MNLIMRPLLARLALATSALVFVTGCSTTRQASMAENGAGSSSNSETSPATKNQLMMRDQPAVQRQSVDQPKEMVLPAGTVLNVRLDQPLGSKISQSGENFSATLPHGVSLGGETAIPAGASVSGTVLDAKPLGRFAGGAALQLKLTSLKLNGSNVGIETSSRNFVAKGKGKRTAVMIGGGSGLGALIGGLAGGGKGALIGAAAGAGAGTAGTAFTGNKDIVLPVESLVSFTLTRELKLKL